MDRGALYKELCSVYEKAHHTKPKKQIQQEVNDIWNKAKQDAATFDTVINEAIDSATLKLSRRKATLTQFWATAQSSKSQEKGCSKQSVLVQTPPPTPPAEPPPAEPSTSATLPPKRPAPAQERIQNQLVDINQELLLLIGRKERGMLTSQEEKRMYQLKVDKQAVEKELKKKVGDQARSQKRRDVMKQSLQDLKEKIPEAGTILNVRSTAGRPRIEEKQPELLKAIVDIALHGSAAHDRRKEESFRSVRTLDDITEALHRQGFDISRSATYLRLIPRRANSSEGLRHIKTVPVKLIKAQNDKHSQHDDGRFCTAAIRMLEELSSLLGPREVFVVSQDDKARVPLGLTAATKQSPMVMHVEYRVSIPDHDFVVAKQHKLIPSVYAAVKIQPDAMGKPEAVGYSGPTYIAIRSAKHSSSTALSHGLDYTRLLELPEFEGFSTLDGEVKPVHVILKDGGPDENPRYQKVIKVAIHHFVSHDLDALFLATNAPGRSAYNRVERRMAPLSKQLSGLILEHEYYGSHLDNQMRTTDPELERKNFGHAGQTLASLWSEVNFDDFPVCAEYIDPSQSELTELIEKDAEWFANHVRSSQYCLQIVKCLNEKCCKPYRSSLLTILPYRFIPPPVPLYQTEFGLKVPNPGTVGNKHFASLFIINSLNLSKVLPNSMQADGMAFDTFCPSVTKRIKERTCKVCKLYFASNVIQKEHSKVHKGIQSQSKIRPKRIVSRRGQEALVVTHDEEREWVETADIEGATIPDVEELLEECCPILAVETRMQAIWTDTSD